MSERQPELTSAFRREKIDLAAALRLAERFGFSEGVCNHFSVQVDRETFLLSPHGIHWSMIKPDDILILEGDVSSNEDT
ncbi:MAG: class II aldolase/adducin family protein, partial [Pseudomonadota bacterium]